MEAGSSVDAGEELGSTSEPLRTKATYPCPLCPKRFIPRSLPEVSRLHWHLITDHNVLNKNSDICPICGGMYRTGWYIRKHIRDVHFSPPRPAGLWRNSGPRPPLHGPSVQCKLCSKRVSKSYIAVHLRAHYNKKLQSAANYQYKSSNTIQERNNSSSVRINQGDYEIFKEKVLLDEGSMANYRIYDLLGTYGKHYGVKNGAGTTIIEQYQIGPSDNASKDNDAVVTPKPQHGDDGVITLDSDSDESQHSDLGYNAQNNAVASGSNNACSVDYNNQSVIDTTAGEDCKPTQIIIKNINTTKGKSQTYKSNCVTRDELQHKESDLRINLVNKSADVVDTSANELNASADVVDLSEDVEEISSDEGGDNAGEEGLSADEEEIAAELEQYIEDNELMEELNSENPSND